jgi:2-polyprenyl-3-methyl-5-hydroxy-6-metoxy-1,4-benzoquinol methylase
MAVGKRQIAERQPLLSELSRQRKLSLLLAYLPVRAQVLEVGAGAGWFATQLRQQGHQVTTLDLNGPADVVGDVREWAQLGLAAHSFDVVVALEVIEHVDCLAALVELCRPGGLIYLSSPHPRGDWIMKILEWLGLTQKRTSLHTNLTDFARLPLKRITLRRPAGIHQVGLFRTPEDA